MYFPISALLIEYLILTIVDTQDSYGYEISQTIKLVADIKESTLYPILEKTGKGGLRDDVFRRVPGQKTEVLFDHRSKEKHRWRTCRANGSPTVTPLTTLSCGGKKMTSGEYLKH